MLNLKTIGQRIAEQRKQRNMNQNELADTLCVTRQAVSKWEMGKGMPSIDALIALTKLFDISIDYLIDDSDVKDNDYAILFTMHPRQSVIYRFLNSDDPKSHVKNIFYLLTPKERKQMIEQSLAKKIDIDIPAIWPYASVSERDYMLSNVMSKSKDKVINMLYPMMSDEERLKVSGNKGITTTIYHLNRKKKKERKN